MSTNTITITVDIDAFISEDEKRNIAHEAFRAACRARAVADFERILSNAGYELAQREVDAAFDGNMTQAVRDKAIEVIKTLSVYTVFKPKNSWENEESHGWTLLQSALDEHQDLIRQRVAEIIEGLDVDSFRESLSDRITDAIFERLAVPRVAEGA